MKTAASRPSAPADTGYWTIQLVLHAGAKSGHQHVCHAENLAQAKAIASHLCGDTRTSAGYDLYRIDRPVGSKGSSLTLGQSQAVSDPIAWDAMTAARIA